MGQGRQTAASVSKVMGQGRQTAASVSKVMCQGRQTAAIACIQGNVSRSSDRGYCMYPR